MEQVRESSVTDMGRFWRLVNVDSDFVTGTFWVSHPLDDQKVKIFYVKAVEVHLWDDGGRQYARCLTSNDLTMEVVDGVARLMFYNTDDKKAAIKAATEQLLEIAVLATQAERKN